MIAETGAYKLLVADEELNAILDEIRGAPFGGGFRQGIFTYDIPEKPTNMKRAELAPFIRIYTTYEAPFYYGDNEVVGTEQRLTINFWCQTAQQADRIAKRMDAVLENGGFERYTANEKPRYWDNDIDLLMSNRKYRYFDWEELEKLKGNE